MTLLTASSPRTTRRSRQAASERSSPSRSPSPPAARSKSPSSKAKKVSSKSSSSDSDLWEDGKGLLTNKYLIMAKYLVLMIITPPFAIIITHASKHMEGACFDLVMSIIKNPMYLIEIWPSMIDPVAWQLILGFMAFQLAMMKLVPGSEFKGTTTPQGNVPVYKANGTACFVIMNVLLVAGAFFTNEIEAVFGVPFRPAIVYDKFPEIISSLNAFALIFCALLYVKACTFPSSTDVHFSGDAITNYYWGVELYPRILGWDVKMFTNCRCGMMFWAAGTVCFAHKAMEGNGGALPLGMFVNVALQLIYVTKFFHWEMGYMCSMDIQVDRGG